jgi:hypothetical protein
MTLLTPHFANYSLITPETKAERIFQLDNEESAEGCEAESY